MSCTEIGIREHKCTNMTSYSHCFSRWLLFLTVVFIG